MITSSTWLVYEPPLVASREEMLRETLELTRHIFQQMRPAVRVGCYGAGIQERSHAPAQ